MWNEKSNIIIILIFHRGTDDRVFDLKRELHTHRVSVFWSTPSHSHILLFIQVVPFFVEHIDNIDVVNNLSMHAYLIFNRIETANTGVCVPLFNAMLH